MDRLRCADGPSWRRCGGKKNGLIYEGVVHSSSEPGGLSLQMRQSNSVRKPRPRHLAMTLPPSGHRLTNESVLEFPPSIAIPRWSPSRHKLLCRRNQRKLEILLLDRQFKWDFRRRQNRVPSVRFYPLGLVLNHYKQGRPFREMMSMKKTTLSPSRLDRLLQDAITAKRQNFISDPTKH